jgi:hypothetical protein
MKKLIALVSTKGKTKEQLKKELEEARKKYGKDNSPQNSTKSTYPKPKYTPEGLKKIDKMAKEFVAGLNSQKIIKEGDLSLQNTRETLNKKMYTPEEKAEMDKMADEFVEGLRKATTEDNLEKPMAKSNYYKWDFEESAVRRPIDTDEIFIKKYGGQERTIGKSSKLWSDIIRYGEKITKEEYDSI